jgi:predicted ester cyclase
VKTSRFSVFISAALLVLAVAGLLLWRDAYPDLPSDQVLQNGQENARTIVQKHLRAVEAGNWTDADGYIGENYRMTGTIPLPISLFVRLGKPQALQMHKPRKTAMPDFRFNEKILEESPNYVKIQVNLSGTQTGVIDYSGVLRDVPVIQPTGKRVNLPNEYFTYYVVDNKIVRTIGDIPKDAGVGALVRAVQQP